MRDIAVKNDNVGDTLSAGDWNANQAELENIVTSSDQTLDPAGGADTDLNMLAKAVAGYAGAAWGYQDSGSANTYVLSIASNLKPITKYFDNLVVVFKPGNDNTGASTVNVGGLGAKAIKINGADPVAGDISTTRIVILKYNLASDYFEAVSGLVQPQFGAWASRSNNTVYQAATDGFVHCYNTAATNVEGLTDSSTPPTTIRTRNGYTTGGNFGITMMVKKNDYWKVTGTSNVFWLPLTF